MGTKFRNEKNALLQAALAYAARGWYVLPVHSIRAGRCSCRRTGCSSPAKHPRTTHGLKNATTRQEIIRAWWNTWPDANVGICTGSLSGLVVVDVDPVQHGEESLAELEGRYGKMGDTIISQTGGGGRHLLFAHPGKTIRNTVQVAGLPGIDVRGDGGYIVAPPSRHISGRQYSWDETGHPDRRDPAPLPGWLLDFLLARPTGISLGKNPKTWRTLVAGGAQKGTRNTSVAALAGYLLYRGVDPLVTLELLLAWNAARNRPPLPQEEVVRVVESIAGREYHRRQEEQCRS